MKKYLFILATAMMVVSAPAYAESLDCPMVGKTARSIMHARQVGVSLTRMMEIVKIPLNRKIVLDAFKTPRYQLEHLQEQATEEFSSSWEAACYRVEEERLNKYNKGDSNV